MAILNVDFTSSGYNKISGEVSNVDKKIKKTEGSVDSLSKSFKSLAIQVLGVVSAYKAFDVINSKVLQTGLEYNKVIENQTQGLTSLIVATSSNISTQGKALTLQEKYVLANKESLEILEDLVEVNNKTPQTLDQTIQVYKTLLPTLGQVGASQQDLLDVTQSLAIASNAYGLEFNQLLAGVDGLATGTVLANSDLGRFLKTIGLSNEALKESDDVVEILIKQLASFNVELDNMGTATSNFDNVWKDLTKSLTEDVFEAQKTSLKELTTIIKNLDDKTINNLRETVNDVVILGVTSIEYVARFVNLLRFSFNGIEGSINIVTTSFENKLLLIQKLVLETGKNVEDTINSIITKLNTFLDGLPIKYKGLKLDVDEVSFIDDEKLEEVRKKFDGFKKSIEDIVQETNSENAKLLEQNDLFKKIADTIRSNLNKAAEETNDELDKANNSLGSLTKKGQTDTFVQMGEIFSDSLGSSLENALIDAVESGNLQESIQGMFGSAGRSLMQTGFSTGNVGALGAGALLLGTSNLQRQAKSNLEKEIDGRAKGVESLQDFVSEMEKATQRLQGFGNTTTGSINELTSLNKRIDELSEEILRLRGGSIWLPILDKDREAFTAVSTERSGLIDERTSLVLDLVSEKLDFTTLSFEELIVQLDRANKFTFGIGRVADITVDNFEEFKSKGDKVNKTLQELAIQMKEAQISGSSYLENEARKAIDTFIEENSDMIRLTQDYAEVIELASDKLTERIELEKEETELLWQNAGDRIFQNNQIKLSIASLSKTEKELSDLRLTQIAQEKNVIANLAGITKTNLTDIMYLMDNLSLASDDYEELYDGYSQYAALLIEEASIKENIAQEQIKAQEELKEKAEQANQSIQDTINKILGISDTSNGDRFLQLSQFNTLLAEYRGGDKDSLTDILSLGASLGQNANLQGGIIRSLESLQTNLTSPVSNYVQDVSVPNSTTSAEGAIVQSTNAQAQATQQQTISNNELLEKMGELTDMFKRVSQNGNAVFVQIAG